MDDFGAVDHVDEDLLHAPHIHGRFELGQSVQPVPHEHDDAAIVADRVALRLDVRVVEPVGTRPVVVGLDGVDACGPGQRRASHLAVVFGAATRLDVNRLSANTPDILIVAIGKGRQRGADEGGTGDIAQIDVVAVEKLLLGQTKFGGQLAFETRRRPQVAGDAVWLFEVEGEECPFSGVHARVSPGGRDRCRTTTAWHR
ncbi:MAG: hypothetical protein CME04_09430 [Gemmatimonadaceae bacterium]|nr:hypothetical protein [Gemmatimonadaceae bacterium]